MTSASDLLTSVQQQLAAENRPGSLHSQDFFADYYLRKRLPPAERTSLAREALMDALVFLKLQKQKILALPSNTGYHEYHEYTPEAQPYVQVFCICAPFAAPALTEDDLTLVFDYFKGPFRTFGEGHHQEGMNFKLLRFGHLLDLLIHYQNSRNLPPALLQKLEEAEKWPAVTFENWEQKRITAIRESKGELLYIKPEWVTSRDHGHGASSTLSAVEMSTGKNWSWFREHPMPFIADRTDFFQILEQLSNLDYSDPYALNPELETLINTIDPLKYETFLQDLFHEIARDTSKRSTWFIGQKVTALQIMVWLLHQVSAPDSWPQLMRWAEKSFTQIKGAGATSRILGESVLKIMAESATTEGLRALLTMNLKAKYAVFRESLDKAIRRAAIYTQVNPDDLDYLFADDFGMTDGKIRCDFGDYWSEASITDGDLVETSWFGPNGKALAKLPAAETRTHADALKRWSARVKDLKAAISGHRQILEAFWRKKTQWSYATWRQYIFDHQVMGILARKMIWSFTTGEETKAGLYLDGAFRGSTGPEINCLPEARVSLWHPSDAHPAETLAWRELLFEKEIRQPVKQAFREVYLITGAETGLTNSLRFAHHYLRHHQLAGLARNRKWNYASVYVSDPPHIVYPDYQLEATLHIIKDGSTAYIESVSFQDLRSRDFVRLETVPKIIFSETMRDVDLFVSVCSIGIDPNPPEQRYRNYWNNYGSGELAENAQGRKALLERILPKLTIGNRCKIQDKYLLVKGHLNNYKIHLGSGHSFILPHEQYLCIVPDSRLNVPTVGVYLPFDDDHLLSLILSKALLLAADDQIQDEVILRQLGR